MPIAPLAVPLGFEDPGRNNKCWPTAPVAAARLDRDALKCFYRCFCYCAPDDLVSRTFLDVHPQGIMANIPCGYCCCMSCDNARLIYYDDPRLFRGEDCLLTPTIKGGCCSPAPFCCPHCFDCCGETLVFRPGYLGCPTGAFHASSMLGPCCCPIDILCGLASGEGGRLAAKINEQLKNFENMGNSVPKPIQVAPGQQQQQQRQQQQLPQMQVRQQQQYSPNNGNRQGGAPYMPMQQQVGPSSSSNRSPTDHPGLRPLLSQTPINDSDRDYNGHELRQFNSQNVSTTNNNNRSSLDHPPPPTPPSFPEWMSTLSVQDNIKSLLVKEQITEASFSMLDESDLKEMGMPLGPRKYLAQEIQKRQSKPTATTPSE